MELQERKELQRAQEAVNLSPATSIPGSSETVSVGSRCIQPSYWSCAQNLNVRRVQTCGLQVTNALKVRAKLPHPQQGTVCDSPCPQEMAMHLGRNLTSHNSNRPQILIIFFKTQSKLNC